MRVRRNNAPVAIPKSTPIAAATTQARFIFRPGRRIHWRPRTPSCRTSDRSEHDRRERHRDEPRPAAARVRIVAATFADGKTAR
jgi:phage terminase large subunit GpA-like protein